MKKIHIITIHCQTNFGSVFQAYSLCKFINDLGYNCSVIDYRPDYIINNYGTGFKRIIKKNYDRISGNRLRKKYNKFIEENIQLTEHKFSSFSDLQNEEFDSDLFISGSDQLWNIGYECGKDDSYKLLFVNDVYKISYATSINTEIMTEEDVHQLKDKLDSFTSISLREKSSSVFFNEHMNIPAKWVCDPVFLLSKDNYSSMCKDNIYQDYILVYLIDNMNLIEPVVSTIKKRTGYKVIYAYGTFPRCKCDIHFKYPGPDEMLSLIRHAKIIVTGSFHATAFSHIFHKSFIVIEPNNSQRIKSLLELTKLEDRVVNDASQCEKINLEVDFSNSQSYIEEFIKESKEWLINNLKMIEDSNE